MEAPVRRSHVAPMVVGLVPNQTAGVISEAARFAMDLGTSIVFSHVELNSALIEQEKPRLRLRLSLDPPVDDEMAATVAGLRNRLDEAESLNGISWTLRVLGGDPARALDRLADQVGARLILVGGPRPGFAHRAEDLLSVSVAGWLARHQRRPLIVIPDANK